MKGAQPLDQVMDSKVYTWCWSREPDLMQANYHISHLPPAHSQADALVVGLFTDIDFY
jgi:hypothetical protein